MISGDGVWETLRNHRFTLARVFHAFVAGSWRRDDVQLPVLGATTPLPLPPCTNAYLGAAAFSARGAR